jgi:hypothetical protein
MSATEYPEIDLKELRRWLFHGDMKQLAVECNYTPDYVSKVINGKRRNMLIVEKGLQRAIANKSRKVSMNENLKR